MRQSGSSSIVSEVRRQSVDKGTPQRKLDHPPHDSSGAIDAVSVHLVGRSRSADRGAESAVSCRIARDDPISMDAKLAV